jgi:hypothetical protein
VYKTPIITLLFLFAFVFTQTAKAQSLEPTVIASDGGFAVLGSGTIAWTLGETVTETFSNANNSLTQGFHQPSLINVNGIGGVAIPGMSVYPNPAAESININLTHLPAGDYSIALFDVLGNKVSEMNVADNRIVFLPLTPFANGVYLLTVSSVSFSQSFKVIKSE